MTFLVERLADLRRHLEHLDGLRSQVTAPEDLTHNMSLHNDVLFSLLTVCQYVALDMRRVVEALDRLQPVRKFLGVVAGIEAGQEGQ